MLQRLIEIFKKHKALFAIATAATVLRFYRLIDMPPSLNWDEVSHGYNAYSILKTGRDEWSKLFPSIFRAYGDYKLPVYIYLTAFFEFIFGLTPFAVRLVSILAGIGTVIFTYFLCIELLKKNHSHLVIIDSKKVAIIASLLVAVEPWTFFISRPAFEANLALFFFTVGLYFIFKFLNSLTTCHLLLTTTFFGLTVWTYNSYRIFTPLTFIIILIFYRKELVKIFKKDKKLISYFLLLNLFFFLPMFWQLFSSQGQARYRWVSILDEGSINKIIEKRVTSNYPDIVTRLLYNRPVYFIEQTFINWTKHLTISFLYLNGGSDFQFNVPGYGLSFLLNLPFFLFGVFCLIKNAFKKDKISLFLLSCLILSPIPSSITREVPHVLRSVTMLPLLMIVAAIGVVTFIYWIKEKVENKKITFILFTVYLGLVLVFSVKYLVTYFNDYRKEYSWSWQYGYQDVADFIESNFDEYDKIVVTKKYGEPHEFLLFYLGWDPYKYQTDSKLNRFYQTNWYWVDSFDKFYFINDWQIVDPELGNYTFRQESGELVDCTPKMFKCLLVTSPGNTSSDWSKIETIDFLNGNVAFELYEN